MNHDVLKTVIADQWDRIRQAEIVPREYAFEPNANYVLTGLRRAGKSTLLYAVCRDLIRNGAAMEQIVFVNFEDERLAEFRAVDLGDLVELHHSLTDQKGFYFLDEIQNIAGWEKFARRMADMKERVYITGSNAVMLSHEMESALGGRYMSKYVMPYNFREYLAALGEPWGKAVALSSVERGRILGHFDTFFTFGGFPESLLFRDRREYLSSVCQKVILGDMAARNGVRNDHVLTLLIKKVAESVCGDISFTKLHRALSGIGVGISKDSVIAYIHYAVQAYLLIPVQNYFSRFSEREGLQKYYFSDNGLLNLYLHNKAAALLENVVAVGLRRRYSEIYYLKSAKTGIDVDFFVPEEELAIQVAYSIGGEARTREVENLLRLSQQFPEARRYYILTRNEEERIAKDGVEIVVMPVWRFLLEEG